jgi:hypothetical protein
MTTEMTEREPFYRTPPIEEAIGHALAALREEQSRAASSPRAGDDYWTTWTRDVLERRPLVVIAVLRLGETDLWLMEPGEEDLLRVSAHHARRELVLPEGATVPPDVATAELEIGTKTHADALTAISWLLKEQSGQFLEAISRGPVG